MLQVGGRSHGDEKIDLLRVVVGKQRPSNEHLCCTLGMAYVGQLVLSSNLEDMIDECWHVVSAHLFLVEVPIGSRVCAQSCMSHSVPRSTIVAEPDVVALLNQNIWRCHISIIDSEKVHVAFNTMHE